MMPKFAKKNVDKNIVSKFHVASVAGRLRRHSYIFEALQNFDC